MVMEGIQVSQSMTKFFPVSESYPSTAVAALQGHGIIIAIERQARLLNPPWPLFIGDMVQRNGESLNDSSRAA